MPFYAGPEPRTAESADTHGRGHNVQWGNRAQGGTAAYVGNMRSRDDGKSWTSLDYDVFAVSASDADIIAGTRYADKSLHLHLQAPIEKILILDTDGRIVGKKAGEGKLRGSLSLKHLAKGCYFIGIQTQKRQGKALIPVVVR